MFAPYDEEFEALPDDAEEGGFAAAPAQARSGSGHAAAGGLVPIGELDDDFYVPPPPDEEEFAPMPDEQADAEALEDGAEVSAAYCFVCACADTAATLPIFCSPSASLRPSGRRKASCARRPRSTMPFVRIPACCCASNADTCFHPRRPRRRGVRLVAAGLQRHPVRGEPPQVRRRGGAGPSGSAPGPRNADAFHDPARAF